MAKRSAQKELDEEARRVAAELDGEQARQENKRFFRKAHEEEIAEQKEAAPAERLAEKEEQKQVQALSKAEREKQAFKVKEEIAQERKLSLFEKVQQAFFNFKQFLKDQAPQNPGEASLSQVVELQYFRVSQPPDPLPFEELLPFDEEEELRKEREPIVILPKVRRAILGKSKNPEKQPKKRKGGKAEAKKGRKKK